MLAPFLPRFSPSDSKPDSWWTRVHENLRQLTAPGGLSPTSANGAPIHVLKLSRSSAEGRRKRSLSSHMCLPLPFLFSSSRVRASMVNARFRPAQHLSACLPFLPGFCPHLARMHPAEAVGIRLKFPSRMAISLTFLPYRSSDRKIIAPTCPCLRPFWTRTPQLS